MTAAIIIYTLTMGLFAWQELMRTRSRFSSNSVELCSLSILLSAVFFIVVVGLRYNVGIDYAGYQSYFESQNLDTKLSGVPYEPFLYFAILIIKSFGFPHQVLFFLFALLQYGLLFLILKRTGKAAPIIAVFYFLTLSFFESLNTTRQSLAVLACTTSFLYWKSNKTLSLFAFIFASTIHVSALIGFPLMLMVSYLRFESHRKITVLTFLACILFSNTITNFTFTNLSFFNVLSAYQNYNLAAEDLFFNKNSGEDLGNYVIYLFDAIIFWSATRSAKDDWTSIDLRILRIFMFGAIINPIVIDAHYLPFGRALMYFYGLKFLAYGLVIRLLSQKKVLINKIIVASITALFLLYFYRAILASAAGVSPYFSVLSNFL